MLIKCPECNKEISDTVDKCIHCGYDITSYVAKEKERIAFENLSSEEKEKLQKEQEKEKRIIAELVEIRKTIRAPSRPQMPKLPSYKARGGNNSGGLFGLIVAFGIMFCIGGLFQLVDGESGGFGIILGIIMIVAPIMLALNQSENRDIYNNKLAIYQQECRNYDVFVKQPEVYYKVMSVFKYNELYPNNTLPKDYWAREEVEKEKQAKQNKYVVQNNSQTSQVPDNTPKCPTCESNIILHIGTGSRIVSTAVFGLASDEIGKQFECENCGYKW